jgi:hypothetical protein
MPKSSPRRLGCPVLRRFPKPQWRNFNHLVLILFPLARDAGGGSGREAPPIRAGGRAALQSGPRVPDLMKRPASAKTLSGAAGLQLAKLLHAAKSAATGGGASSNVHHPRPRHRPRATFCRKEPWCGRRQAILGIANLER